MEEELLKALRRLYAGDASASRELEAFQLSPGALDLSTKWLKSSIPEVQFFAASTICRIASAQDSQVDIQWLLQQAMQLISTSASAARRQLVHAAANLGAGQSHVKVMMTNETWPVSLDLLLAMSSSTTVDCDLGQLLICCLGQQRDEDVWRCCLKFPQVLQEEGLVKSLERAIVEGRIGDIESPEKLTPDLCQRFKVAAVEALRCQHWDVAASFLLDLPLFGNDLLDAADFLLRSSPSTSCKLKAIELWTRFLSPRSLYLNASELDAAWRRFQLSAMLAAAWKEDEADEMWNLRDALWTLIRRWQLTPKRPSLLASALERLWQLMKIAEQDGWQSQERETEVLLWIISKYAKTLRGRKKELAGVGQVATKVLQIPERRIGSSEARVPLLDSTLRLLESLPCAEAVPLLFKASRVSVSPDALPNALAACCALCRGKGVATEAWFVGLQQRALEGEVDFVKAAAELLEDVRPLAQTWAKLCLEATPQELPVRARGLVYCMARPEVCQMYWRDCAQVLVHVPVEEQVHFVQRLGGFAMSSLTLLEPAIEVWRAVWPRAEGDEELVLTLEQLVQVSARRSDVAATALQMLCRSLANASSWAPQVVSAALGAVEASVTPSGSAPWPLTPPMVPFYGPVLQCAATISSTQKVSLCLVGLLLSWNCETKISTLGPQFVELLRQNEAAVRILCAQSDEEDRATQRIKHALGL